MQYFILPIRRSCFENIREELTKIDINTLTPIEALMKLNTIKKMIERSNLVIR